MKKGLVVAAAALVASVVAAPASAAEFSYGGFMRFNYQGGNPGTVTFDGGDTFYGFDEADGSVNVFEYRIRQFFNLKVNDHVSTNVKFEWNSQFGDENAIAGGSGDLQFGAGANELQFRVKNAFVRFDVPGAPVAVTVGQQDFSTPKAIISVEDGAGVKLTFSPWGAESSIWWTRLTNGGQNETGAEDAHWFGIAPAFAFGDITVSPHLSWVLIGQTAVTTFFGPTGRAAFLPAAAIDSASVYFYGVDASGKVGPLGFTADLIFQQGDFDTAVGSRDLFAYVLDASATLDAGPGALTVKALYSPGDDTPGDGDVDSWQQIISTDMGWSPFFHDGSDNSNFAGTVLPAPIDGAGGGGGIIAFGAEYALSPSKALTVTPNAYYLMAAEDVNAFGGPNTDDFYGVELGVQASYKVWDAVTLLAQFDYLLAGDVFEDPTTGDTKDAWRVLVGPRISW